MRGYPVAEHFADNLGFAIPLTQQAALGKTHHGFIVALDDPTVAVIGQQVPRHVHDRGGPDGRDALVVTGRGRDGAQPARRVLRAGQIFDPLGIEGGHIEIVDRRLIGHVSIGRPALFLAVRTVGRNAVEIVQQTRARHVLQTVDHIVRADETSGLGHVGMNRYGLDPLDRDARIGRHADELKTHVRETALERLRPLTF